MNVDREFDFLQVTQAKRNGSWWRVSKTMDIRAGSYALL